MPYTMADFESDTRKWLLKSVKKELARKTFSPAQVLNELFSPEEVVKSLPPKMMKKLSPRLVKELSPEEVIKTLPPELLQVIPQGAIDAYLAKQKKSRRKSS